jgi:hypothetical protein
LTHLHAALLALLRIGSGVFLAGLIILVTEYVSLREEYKRLKQRNLELVESREHYRDLYWRALDSRIPTLPPPPNVPEPFVHPPELPF